MALSRFLFAVPVLALVLAAGCDEPEPVDDLDASALSERFACDDLTLVAASEDGERALMIGIDDGLVAESLATGEVVETQYQLPDDRLTVRWVSGSNVYQGACGRDSGTPWELDERNDAISGTMSIRVMPPPPSAQGAGTGPDKAVKIEAELHDVLLADADGDGGEGEGELYLALAEFHDLRVD